MQSVAFVAPILPGKTQVDRDAMRECMEGDRRSDYEASRKHHGISREAVWIQETPGGDMAVVYLEAEDPQSALQGLGSSQEPFDKWFRDIVRECHGIDLSHGFAPPDQVVDFRRT